jgi:hypothetical protein
VFLGLLSLASAPVGLNRRGFDGVLTQVPRLVDLCEDPRGVGDRAGKVEAVVPCPECRDPWFDQ